jgi:hypothetical protein
MKTHRFILAALLAGLAYALPARAAESITVRAVLIMASDKKAPADPKLAEFEAELQRNAPESSFKFVREGSITIPDGGHGTISLGSGDSVEVEAKKTAGSIQSKLHWMKGEMGGTYTQKSGLPIVLGRRPAGDGETPIVIVVAK